MSFCRVILLLGFVVVTIKGYSVSIYNDNTANPGALRAVLDQDVIRDLPIVVIPVAGEYRGGKSFLLSYFLRYLTQKNFGEENDPLVGFDHARASAPVTQGINIWSKPLIVNDTVVLLMDSQGILGRKEDNKVATKVFALSTMVSSVMIFNLKNQINEGVWSYLELFTSYATEFTTDNGEVPFQKLMILIRDWQNDDVFGYKGGNQYLDEYFADSKNAFGKYFNVVSCFLMPHPGSGVENKNYNGNLKELREVFKENMKELISDIHSPENLAKFVKQVDGNNITAGEFCDYFKKITELMEKKDWNENNNIVEMIAMFTCEKAKNSAINEYISYMDKEIDQFILEGVTESSARDLEKSNEFALQNALKIYENGTTNAKRNAPEILEQKMQALNEMIDEKYAGYRVTLLRMIVKESTPTIEQSIRSLTEMESTMEKIIDEIKSSKDSKSNMKWISSTVAACSSAAWYFAAVSPPVSGAIFAFSSILGLYSALSPVVVPKEHFIKLMIDAKEAKYSITSSKGLFEEFVKKIPEASSDNFGSDIGAGGYDTFGAAKKKATEFFTGTGLVDDGIAEADDSFNLASKAKRLFDTLITSAVHVEAVLTQITENTSSINTVVTLKLQIRSMFLDLNEQLKDLSNSLKKK